MDELGWKDALSGLFGRRSLCRPASNFESRAAGLVAGPEVEEQHRLLHPADVRSEKVAEGVAILATQARQEGPAFPGDFQIRVNGHDKSFDDIGQMPNLDE